MPCSSSGGCWIDSSDHLFHFSLCVVIEASYACVSTLLRRRLFFFYLVRANVSPQRECFWSFSEGSRHPTYCCVLLSRLCTRRVVELRVEGMFLLHPEANAVCFLRNYADYCRTACHIILPIKANRFLAFQMCRLVSLLHAVLRF